MLYTIDFTFFSMNFNQLFITFASSLTAVSKCERPMLFIHGTADDFIPYSMMNELYEAKPGTNKQMLTAEGATHANSLYLLGESYWNTVFDFINSYIK